MLGSLHLYKVEDIEVIRSVYSFMYKHRLNLYVLYTPNNPRDINKVLNKIQVDKCLIETEKGVCDEFFYDIIDHNLERKIAFLCNSDTESRIKDMLDEVGIDLNLIINSEAFFSKKQDLNNYLTKNIVLELFDDYPNQKNYSPYNFLLNFKVLNDGKVLVNEDEVGDLKKESFDEIYLRAMLEKKDETIEKIKVLDAFNLAHLNVNFPEPLVFIQNSEDIEKLCEKIIALKLDIFDQIKNIKLRQYNVIPDYLLDIMIKTQYVSIDDIEEVSKK